MAAASKSPADSGALSGSATAEDRPLFEACKNGDVDTVKALATTHNVNLRDTTGRKSTPLHFAAG